MTRRELARPDPGPHDGAVAVRLGAQDLGLAVEPGRDVLAAQRARGACTSTGGCGIAVAEDLEHPLDALRP